MLNKYFIFISLVLIFVLILYFISIEKENFISLCKENTGIVKQNKIISKNIYSNENCNDNGCVKKTKDKYLGCFMINRFNDENFNELIERGYYKHNNFKVQKNLLKKTEKNRVKIFEKCRFMPYGKGVLFNKKTKEYKIILVENDNKYDINKEKEIDENFILYEKLENTKISNYEDCEKKAKKNYFAFVPRSTNLNTIEAIKKKENKSKCVIIPEYKFPENNLKKISNKYCKSIKEKDKNLGGFIDGNIALSLYKNDNNHNVGLDFEDEREPKFTIDDIFQMEQDCLFIGGNNIILSGILEDNNNINYKLNTHRFIKDYSGNKRHINITKKPFEKISNNKIGLIDCINIDKDVYIKLESKKQLLKNEKGYEYVKEGLGSVLEDKYNKQSFTIYMEYLEEESTNNEEEIALLTRSVERDYFNSERDRLEQMRFQRLKKEEEIKKIKAIILKLKKNIRNIKKKEKFKKIAMVMG